MSDTDLELLARYIRQRAEDDFAELVRRHLGLVYSAALRQVRSPQLAEEVAQSVFTDLARRAAKLKPDTVLAAWLYQVTRRTAIDVVRREASRQLREQIATEMNAMNATAADWTHIEPLLDEAMHALDDTDRAAVLLRYFENKSLREVGATLGTSENAAQKRLGRAVERLREFFAKRGVTVGASGLVIVISANAVQAAPIGLAVTISTAAALAGTTILTTTTATVGKAIAMTTLQKTLIAALVVAGAATPWMIQHQAQLKLREENQSLRQQNVQLQTDNENLSNRVARAKALRAPRLPAPPIQSAAPDAAAAENLSITNLYARLKGKNPVMLTAQQIQPYLDANRRSAASLLAGFRTTGDAALLEEAMQKFPTDPQVSFEAAFRKDALPAERRQWLDAFKKSAPDNPLADYLSAADYFKAGQTDQAVQDLIAASAKRPFQDYSLDRIQDDEEAFRAAGYPVVQAKVLATSQLLLPQLVPMRQVAWSIVDLASSYQQAGDEASRQAALEMAINLGRRYSEGAPGELLISQFFGIAAERYALTVMDPNSPYGDNGQTVHDRLSQLVQQRTLLQELTKQADPIFQTIPEQDWISYHTRSTAFGEEAALRWLISKYGQR